MRTTGPPAPLRIAGAVNGAISPAWVEQHLVRELKPGDVAVVDDLSVHRAKGVREAIGAAGAGAADLPPYSPDFDPIELMFNKFKAAPRSGAARTAEALWKLCGTACDAVTRADRRAFFSHCGYRHA